MVLITKIKLPHYALWRDKRITLLEIHACGNPSPCRFYFILAFSDILCYACNTEQTALKF